MNEKSHVDQFFFPPAYKKSSMYEILQTKKTVKNLMYF